jgi:SAM-dependent methyltransferase
VTAGFDKGFWDSHWEQSGAGAADHETQVNPYLVAETVGLLPGTALDAGCGEGAEAVWLAERGWQVTAVDISSEALARARTRAERSTGPVHVDWVEADLTAWEPDEPFDLVTTHYAHPRTPQLAFYERLAGWVAPGGTLLVVGHQHTPDAPAHEHGDPSAEASVDAASVAALLDPAGWDVVTAAEHVRTTREDAGRPRTLHDVVVRATRRAAQT